MKVPSAQEIAKRFVTYAPGRAGRYADGVANPDEDWEKNTADAESNYEEGIKKAITRKAFGKGVHKCGTAKQKAQTLKNLPRWAEGIEGAESEMAAAMTPVVAVMEGITLPKKYPKGDPRNYERNKIIGTTLRKAKEDGRI